MELGAVFQELHGWCGIGGLMVEGGGVAFYVY